MYGKLKCVKSIVKYEKWPKHEYFLSSIFLLFLRVK